jgi:hypothetical protein
VEVDAVASVWVNVGFKLAGVRECCTNSGGNASERGASRRTRASTVYGVDLDVSRYSFEALEIRELTLFTSQDESGSVMRTSGRSSISKSEDLSKCNRLLSAFSKESGANIEVTRVQEGKDICYRDRSVRAAILWFAQLTGQIAPGEISCGQVLCDHSSVPPVDNVANLSSGNLLPDIRGREIDTNSTESRLNNRNQALTEPSNVVLST